MDWLATAMAAFTVMVTVIGGLYTVSNTLGRKIEAITSLVYLKTEGLEKAIFNKIDNHESQDNQRFSAVSDGIWDLRVRMAAKEGIHPTTVIPHEKG